MLSQDVLLIKCPHDGCDRNIGHDRIKDHINNCGHRSVICNEPGCSKVLLVSGLAQHKLTDCVPRACDLGCCEDVIIPGRMHTCVQDCLGYLRQKLAQSEEEVARLRNQLDSRSTGSRRVRQRND